MIIKLPPEVSNQIAAGEVVERPASVVKELVENSIDAGAKKIFVEVENAGKDLIRVRDDGHGIASEDIELLFERNATSKVKNIEDVYNINSLGFRGEALASIASVSKIQVITRTESEALGKRALYYNGRVQSLEDSAGNLGTSFSVSDLFYNTPVRYKFMKSSSTEKAKITSILGKIAMSRPDISFTLTFDGKDVFSSLGNGDLKDTIGRIYGREFSNALVPIDAAANDVKISGFIAKQEYNRGNKAYQFVIVNGRVVESPLIKKILDEAYHGFIMKHRHQAYVVVIDLPPNMVDVNIHPQKLELKFVREDILESLLYNTVRNALIRQQASRPVDISETVLPHKSPKLFDEFESKSAEQIYLTDLIDKKTEIQNPTPVYQQEDAPPSHAKKQDSETSFSVQDDHLVAVDKEILSSDSFYKDFEFTEGSDEEDLGKDLVSEGDGVSDFRSFVDRFETNLRESSQDKPLLDPENISIVGQLFKTFIICESGDTAFVIDQHAAHERVLFERFYKNFEEKGVESQLLIEPIVYIGNPAELDTLEGAMGLFENMGIILERRDETTWLIKSVPIFGTPISEDEIKLIVESYTKNGNKAYHKGFLDAIIMKSCKSAIKSGDVLNEVQMRDLLRMLYNCDNPHSCPHGRPATIELKRKDFDKIFKRIV